MHSSSIVGDTACPECRRNGRDSTGNHLIMFEDGGAYCNRCDHKCKWQRTNGSLELHPYDNSTPVAPLELTEEDMNTVPLSLNDVESLPTLGLPARSISMETMDKYGVRCSVSPTDRSVENIYYPEYKNTYDKPVGYKVELPGKEFSVVGKTKDCEFFGIKRAREALSALPKGGRTLYITEGEKDCMSLEQALCELANTPNPTPAVVSLPAGAAHAAKAMAINMDFINEFNKVVLCFDKDKPGQTATDEAACVIGAKAFVWGDIGGFKDANEALMAGALDTMKKAAVADSVNYMPKAIATVDDLMLDVLKVPEYGLSYPWPSLTEATFGLKRGLLIGIGAGVGIGKTDFFSQLSAHLMEVHNEPVGQFRLEEQPARTVKAIAGKIAHTPFHRPDMPFEESLLVDTIESLRGKIYCYNHFGFKGWSDIKRDIRTLSGYGVHYFIVDPLTALIAQEDNEYKALNSMMEEMAALTQDLNVTIFYSSHLNLPTNGPSHEDGGPVKEAQFTGSRAMIRWSHYILGISRNKNALDENGEPDLETRNTAYIQMLKDREYGRTCRFAVKYNPDTTDFLEPTDSTGEF